MAALSPAENTAETETATTIDLATSSVRELNAAGEAATERIWAPYFTPPTNTATVTPLLAVRLALSPGEVHDVRLAGKLLSRLKSGSMLLADRGYDADWIRAFAGEHGAWANIPPKRNRKDPICFSPYLYRARNLVERFFNRIKQCRHVATRYDKLATNYLAFIKTRSHSDLATRL